VNLWKASNWCRVLRLSTAGLTGVTAAVFQVQQFIAVVLYKQGEFFCQRHRFGKITDSIFDSWFFLFGTHKTTPPSGKEKGVNEKIFKN
jgi:hypothetical protein